MPTTFQGDAQGKTKKVSQDIPTNDENVKAEEAALVRRAKTEPEAFGELYERYVKRIYNYVYYRTGNHHDAEDLTARVFQRAMQNIGKYVDRGIPFSAWLYRIAHNLVANWHRNQGRRKVIPLDEFIAIATRSTTPEDSAESSEEKRLLLEAIRRLPEDRQQLVILKFVEHMSNAQIGQVMNRSEGAIKSLYHRTLIALRDDFDAHYNNTIAPDNPRSKRNKRRRQK